MQSSSHVFSSRWVEGETCVGPESATASLHVNGCGVVCFCIVALLQTITSQLQEVTTRSDMR